MEGYHYWTHGATEGSGMGKLCQVLENGLELMGGLSKESVLEDTMWARCRNLEPKSPVGGKIIALG